MKTTGIRLQIIKKIFGIISLAMLIVYSIHAFRPQVTAGSFDGSTFERASRVQPEDLFPETLLIAKADTSNPYLYIVGRSFALNNLSTSVISPRIGCDESDEQRVSKKSLDAVNKVGINSILIAQSHPDYNMIPQKLRENIKG